MAGSTLRLYSYAFFLPAGIIYILFFIAPTFLSFFFSLTIWTLSDWRFTGLDNFRIFFTEPSLSIGLRNSLIYAISTCALKVVLGFLLAAFLCTKLKTRGFLRSLIYFPNILSTIAVGIIFSSLMHPSHGLINSTLGRRFRIISSRWLKPDEI